MAEPISLSIAVKQERNYQLDVIKLILALLVVLFHCGNFIGENTNFTMPVALGWWTVQFFFVISGFLMVNSVMGKNLSPDMPEERSLGYVLRRYRTLCGPVLMSLLLSFVAICVIKSNFADNLILYAQSIVPDIFLLSESGLFGSGLNGAIWYISAMLITMLPLYYFLLKKPKVYLYVFSPLISVILIGTLYNQPDGAFVGRTFTGLVYSTLLKAVCGLCLGAVGWVIYDRLIQRFSNATIRQKAAFTVMELLGYAFVIWLLFNINACTESIYSAYILFPALLALSFSRLSYFHLLFRGKLLKYCSALSLGIYLNHLTARYITMKCLPGGFRYSLMMTAVITLGLCLVSYVGRRFMHLFWGKVVVPFLEGRR